MTTARAHYERQAERHREARAALLATEAAIMDVTGWRIRQVRTADPAFPHAALVRALLRRRAREAKHEQAMEDLRFGA